MMTRGKPQRRGTAMLVLMATVTVMVLGASAASAAPAAPQAATNSATPVEACKALVDGTAATRNGKIDGVSRASKSCATVCGIISAVAEFRGRLSKVTVDDARLACAAACDFILVEGANQVTRSGRPLSGPVASAVTACQLLEAGTTGDTAGLPLIENGGRSWR